MTPADPLIRAVSVAMGVGRIAIGVGLAFAPRQALRALGFPDPSAATIVVSRLAGGRDVVVGALILTALEDPRRLRSASLAAAAVDAGDALTFAASLKEDELQKAALRGLAAAVPATLAGIWIAGQVR